MGIVLHNVHCMVSIFLKEHFHTQNCVKNGFMVIKLEPYGCALFLWSRALSQFGSAAPYLMAPVPKPRQLRFRNSDASDSGSYYSTSAPTF
jgi:hypothetical protein